MSLRITRKDRQAVWIGNARVEVRFNSGRGGIQLLIDAPKEIDVAFEERLSEDEIEERLEAKKSTTDP